MGEVKLARWELPAPLPETLSQNHSRLDHSRWIGGVRVEDLPFQ
jgi:hypothetical protein